MSRAMFRVAVLNSHQSKTPVGDELWVRQTIAAVDHAARQGWTIISSVDLNTWELVTWAAARVRASLEIVVPHPGDETARQTIVDDFVLDLDRVRWHSLGTPSEHPRPKTWWTARDEFISSHADILLPVSVRPGGRIDSLMAYRSAGQTVDERFRIPYDPRAHHERSLVDRDRVNPQFDDWGAGFLIHWTRARHGPWPAECAADYYADLVASGDIYCRSALATLTRIVGEGIIRASSWRVGAKHPMVAFTALSPGQSLPLMRWRTRWSRWSFEPYGIAIHRDWAGAHGVRAVCYVTEAEWKRLPSHERPFCHRRGRAADIWPAEQEWRHQGDVRLSDVPLSDVRLIVRRESEATTLRETIPFPVCALELS
ncbi:MAG: hypothetical protein AB1792_05470 [Candidatus Zixiibacteriota bacterium]